MSLRKSNLKIKSLNLSRFVIFQHSYSMENNNNLPNDQLFNLIEKDVSFLLKTNPKTNDNKNKNE